MTEHRKQEHSNAIFAIALRARDLISNEKNWIVGYRLKDSRMCLVGAVLMAMGAQPRKADVNFDPTDFEYETLGYVMDGLGFDGYLNAENFNDANDHSSVIARMDTGLQDWSHECMTAKYKEDA